jgi:hypothetical protein
MNYIKPFAIGGSVIAGSKYLSTFASPSLAPLIGGIPTGIISSMFLANDSDKRKYYEGYMYSAGLLFIAVMLSRYLTVKTKIPVDYISMGAILMWAILSYITINYMV